MISSLQTSPDRDSLKAFAAPVLVPFDGQTPFADLQLELVNGSSNGYSLQFGEGMPDSPQEPYVTVGAIRSSGVSSADPRYFTRCNPTALYCAWTTSQERFLGLQVKQRPAIASHVTATVNGNPEGWAIDWQDPASGATYSLHFHGALATPFGTAVSANNPAAAQRLAAIADQLVSL